MSRSPRSARGSRRCEQLLRVTLFVRNKAECDADAAGRQFQKHASTLVQQWNDARQDVGIAKGFSGTLTVGGRIGLWEEHLLHWLPLMRAKHPDIAIRAESALEAELMQGLVEGRIDIGVMYTPQSRPGLKVEQLFDEQLILVSTSTHSAPEPQSGYVYIDWGGILAATWRCFRISPGPSLAPASIGWLGLQHVLENGGSGYFPRRITVLQLKAGRLHAVADAPEFSMPAYVVYPGDRDDAIIAEAVLHSCITSRHDAAGKEARACK